MSNPNPFEGPTPADKFQRDTLQLYADGDVEFEKDLIQEYKTSVQTHLPQLVELMKKDTLTKQEAEDAVLHSHDIKGCSAYVGAEAVRFVSGRMEFYCKEHKFKEAAQYIDELQKEVTEIFNLLDKYVSENAEDADTDK